MSIPPRPNYEARVDPCLIRLLTGRVKQHLIEPVGSHDPASAQVDAGHQTEVETPTSCDRDFDAVLDDVLLRQDGQRPVRFRAALIWTGSTSFILQDGRSVTRTLSVFRDSRGTLLAHAILQPTGDAGARPVYRVKIIAEPADFASFEQEMRAELCFHVTPIANGWSPTRATALSHRFLKPETVLA